MKAPHANETAIQGMILDGLRLMGVFAWRSTNFPAPIRRGREIVGFRKANQETVGMPDIMAVINGRLLGVEVKSETGRQRPEQKEWEQKLNSAGAFYIVARGWDEVEAMVKRLRMIK